MNSKKRLEINDVVTLLQQIDYVSIITALSPIISYYATKKVKKSYVLHRSYKPKNVSNIILPPELIPKYSDIDIKKVAAQKFGGLIILFAKVMKDKFPDKDLINFYNNVNELSVKSKAAVRGGFSFNIIYSGVYDTLKNEIVVADSASIYHELFHMASSIRNGKYIYSGFSQTVMGSSKFCGNGINEGYTQLLTERYFSEFGVNKSYPYHVKVVSCLEKIVGRQKMETLYLNANLSGLINELTKYVSQEVVMKFIAGMDFFHLCRNIERPTQKEREMLKNSLININEFLLRGYIAKLKEQIDKKTLSVEEMELILSEYITSLGSVLQIGKDEYEFLTLESLKEIVEEELPGFELFGKNSHVSK